MNRCGRKFKISDVCKKLGHEWCTQLISIETNTRPKFHRRLKSSDAIDNLKFQGPIGYVNKCKKHTTNSASFIFDKLQEKTTTIGKNARPGTIEKLHSALELSGFLFRVHQSLTQ